MENRKYCIYTLKDPITNIVRYVGCTLNPKSRYSSHLSYLRQDDNKKVIWISDLKNKGLKPIMTILDKFDSIKDAQKMEILMYKKLSKENELYCQDPNRHKYVEISLESASLRRSRNASTVKYSSAETENTSARDFLKITNAIHVNHIAYRMWPKNKTANSYLSQKLNGDIPWTENDENLAKIELKKFADDIRKAIE